MRTVLLLLIIQTFIVSENIDENSLTSEGNKSCPSSSSFSKHNKSKEQHGVDISWPMHHAVSTNYPWLQHNILNENKINKPSQEVTEKIGVTSDEANNHKDMPIQPLGNRQEIYEEYMKGCYEHYKSNQICNDLEKERIDMNIRQPQSMRNYTKVGYEIIRAPEKVFTLVKNFWDVNKESYSLETWDTTGNIHTNHWSSPSYMVRIENSSLIDGGVELSQRIWDAVEETLENWIGSQQLETSSLYGIRVYTDGAILAPHVDRLPLVSSAIINVDQDVDEDWPLEVIGHDGKATNITMRPGDMILYESHSIIHGRPFALKGRFFANLFIHFAPITKNTDNKDITEEVFILPSYIIKDSPEYQRQINLIQEERNKMIKNQQVTIGTTLAHKAAQEGEVSILQYIAEHDISMLNQIDENGWTPFHEAARTGQMDAMVFLINNCKSIGRTVEELIGQKTNAGDTSVDVVDKFYYGANKKEVLMFLKQNYQMMK